MDNVEQLFQNAQRSEYFAYLQYEESEDPKKLVTQTYDQITWVIQELDGACPSELHLLRGKVLEEDQSKYTIAEVSSYNRCGISYVFFKSQTENGIASILAKITEKKLDQYDKIFCRENCDSREEKSLKKNEVIVNGVLSTSEYLAICYGGNWYAYADREKGMSLTIPDLHNKEDLILVNTK